MEVQKRTDMYTEGVAKMRDGGNLGMEYEGKERRLVHVILFTKRQHKTSQF